MNNRIWKIIESILWLIISVTQVAVHTTYMVKNGIDWHMVFVIVFSVLFGCWLVLLLDHIFNDED
jgi:hypothetical protein